MSTTAPKRTKPKTFVIVEAMKVKGPYKVEGTNQSFDFANEYPLPAETIAIINGKSTVLRYILGCDTLIKEEQIKLGYPADRAPTEEERALLTFVGSHLTVPEDYPRLEEYITSAPWNKAAKSRPANSRIIYEELNQDSIEENALNLESLILQAKQIVLGEKNRDKLMNLYRFTKPGGIVNPQIETRTIKLQLLETAAANPDLIIKGAKIATESIAVLVTKAIDYEILNIDIVGKLSMKNKNGEIEPFANIPDMGGRAAKIERVVNYIQTDEAKGVLEEVKLLVAARDKEINASFEDEEVTTNQTTEAPTDNTTTVAPE